MDMTSRQRVQAVLACDIPDRVPIHYSANPGIDRRLKAHYGLAADDHEGLRCVLGVDARGVNAPYVGPPLHEQQPGIRVNPMWGIRTRFVEHDSGSYWDYCGFPLRDADEETVASWPMPSPDDFDYSGIAEACKRLGTFAVQAGGAGTGCIINSAGFLRGMEQVFVDLITDDSAGLLLIDRKLDIELEVVRRTIEAAGGWVDYLMMGEDLGTQKGPIISMATFRKHVRPRHVKFLDMAKAYGIPVMMHTCGSSSWSYEDYIEMGLSAVDTLQPEATNMAPAYLKEHYGGRLAFRGCISTAGVVAHGTVQDTIDDCRQTLETMMPGGGYWFAPTHQLQDNSPTENVVAMYEAAHRYGVY
jgi:uroporphyrinogen decarboxylase